MVKYCVAPGCSKNDRDKTVNFHCLPKLLKMWTTNVKLKNSTISKHSRICSSHFTPDWFKRDLPAVLLGLPPKHRLKSDAVPTLFDFSSCSTKVTDVPSTSSGLKIQTERPERVKRRSSWKEIQEVSKYILQIHMISRKINKTPFKMTLKPQQVVSP